MSLTSEVLITGGLIAAIAAVGGVCTWLGRRLPLPLPHVLVLISCAWGVMGMAVVTLPSLGEVGARALSLETPLDTVSQIASLILLFYAGLRAPKRGDQRVGSGGLWSGLAAAGLALVLGSVVGMHFGYGWQRSSLVAALAMAPSLAMVAVTDERSPQHRTVVSTANRFNQILAGLVLGFLLIFTIVGASSNQLGEGRNGVVTTILLIKTALFFAFAWFLGSRYARRFAQNPKRELTIRLLTGFILMLILLYVYASQFLGQLAALVWAYLAGILFAKTEFRGTLVPGLQGLTYLICLPLLFFSGGLKVQIGSWGVAPVLIVAFATLGRVVGGILGVEGGSLAGHEPLWAGLLAMPQAEMGVILAGYALDRGLVGGGEFNFLMVAAIASTLLGTLLAGRFNSPSAVAAGNGPTGTQGSLT